MTRPTEDQTNLKHARVASERSTCIRRAVGCVLVDEFGHVLSTGRNGVPKGQPHCNEGHPCKGANAPSGTGLTECRAIHAEINAVAHCPDPSKVDTIYITDSPCKFCCDALMALPNAKRIVAAAPYAGSGDSKERWEAMGRTWEVQPIIATHWFGWDEAIEADKTIWFIHSRISGAYWSHGKEGFHDIDGRSSENKNEAMIFKSREEAYKFLTASFPASWEVISGLG